MSLERLFIVALTSATLTLSASFAGLAVASPTHGLLVLANGSILEGVVSDEGEHFRVMLPRGELKVRNTEVDFFCQDIEEAYTCRRERYGGTTADSHLEMARWCVQQGLLNHAAEELAEARRLEPQHRLLDVVARQVDYAGKSVTQPNESTAAALESPRPIELVTADVDDSPVVEVPQWARVEFVRRIQPMLIHTCATSGCHVPGSPQGFQLDREALAGIGSPERIHENLVAVLRTVDLHDNEGSMLITRGVAAHGNSPRKKSQPLSPRQVAILQAWITQLAHALAEETADVPTADLHAEEEFFEKQVGGATDSLRPRAKDPFDPSLFNRNHVEDARPATLLPSAKEPRPDPPPQEVVAPPHRAEADSLPRAPSPPVPARENKDR